MKRAWLLVPALALLTSLGTGIPGERIGLVHQDILAVPVPPAVRDNPNEPGDGALAVRWSGDAPPMIPHGVTDLVPITRSDNFCLECHAIDEEIEGEATPIPASHYRDLRSAPEVVRETIAGSRYVCTSCHAPQTEADPLPVDTR